MRLCAFFVAILITVTSTAQNSLHEDLKLARKYFNLQEFNQSRIFFESVEDYAQLGIEDLRRLSQAYEALGDREDAIDRGQDIIKLPEVDNADFLYLANLLKKEARYAEASFVLQNYAQRGGEDARRHIQGIEFAQTVLEYERNCDLENLAINTSSAESGISFIDGDLVYATHRVELDGRFGIKGGLDDRPKSVLLKVDTDAEDLSPIKVQDREGDQFGFASYAANGKMMVYVRSEFKPEAAGLSNSQENMALFYAIADEYGVWEEDRSFPYNSTQYANGFPYLNEDGTTLFYASNMEDGQGGFDIYVSHFKNGTWSVPTNLGAEVNTPGNEITPFVTEGKLYFASDYLPGLGGYDVFSIKNVNNAWTDLSHMGACVNSPEDDYGFVIDPNHSNAYFASTRMGGKGHDDLYKVNDASSISEIQIVQPQISELPAMALATSPQFTQKSTIKEEISSIPNIEVSEEEIVVSEGEVDRLVEVAEVISRDLGDIAEVSLVGAEGELNLALDIEENAIELETVEDVVWTELEEEEVLDIAMVDITETETEEDLKDFAFKGVYLTEVETLSEIDHIEMNTSEADLAVGLFDHLEIEDHPAITLNMALPIVELETVDAVDLEGILLMDDSSIKGNLLLQSEKVYFIQIAALSRYTDNLERFSHFKRFGNVYQMKSGNVVKIRLGYYKTQAEALKVLKVLKEKGIREAFIVGDILDANRMEVIASRHDNDVIEESKDFVSSYRSKYKVRVAAYQLPSKFQTSVISDLGHIEHWTKGEWKIIVLSGYSKKDQAEFARRQAVKRGFKDAFIVKDQNGTLTRVK